MITSRWKSRSARRFAALAALVPLLLSFLGAQAAAAAPVTLGETGATIPCGGVDNFVQVASTAPGYEIPPGVWRLTSFSTQGGGGAAGSVQLQVWRRTADDRTFRLVGASAAEAITVFGNNTFTLTSPLVVWGGDLLGMRNADGMQACGTAFNGDQNITYASQAAAPAVGGTTVFPIASRGGRLNISAVVEPLPLSYNPISSTRVVDTRLGLGAPQTQLAAGQTLEVQVTGGSVPAGAVSATLNITATNSEAGFLTVFPCDQVRPGTSTINPQPTYAVANLSTVALSGNGTVCVYSENRTDLIVDALGWWGATGLNFNPVNATRLVDTRLGLGAPQARVGAGQTLAVQVTGLGGVPPGATVATVNVTATNSDTGFLTVYPCDQPRPGTSTINPRPTFAVANLSTVALSAAGTLCVYSENATDLIVDSLGWWSGSGLPFDPTASARIVDTRLGVGAPQAPLTAGQVLTVQVAGAGGVPAGATSAMFNVTTTNSQPGFITMYPCDQPLPGTSTINPQPSFAVANLATVALSATGTVCVFAENPTDVIIDTLGWLGTP